MLGGKKKQSKKKQSLKKNKVKNQVKKITINQNLQLGFKNLEIILFLLEIKK